MRQRRPLAALLAAIVLIPLGGVAVGTAAQAAPASLRDPGKRDIAQSFISSAENSTLKWWEEYDYIEEYSDHRGYTAGIVGFTTGTGDLLVLVKNYTQKYPSNRLAKWIDELEAADGSDEVGNLGQAFMDDWIAEAQVPAFQAAQRHETTVQYFEPSVDLAIADKLGPLGQLAYYDAAVMHGFSGLEDIRTTAKQQASTPAAGGSEKTYLTKFLDARRAEMASEPAHREFGRVDTAQRVWVNAENFNLDPPLSWKVYDEATPFSIPTLPTPRWDNGDGSVPSSGTLISQGKPVTASSTEGAGFEAAKAVDGNATSRWASVEGVDPQWLRIDLGTGAKIDRVVLKWEAAYAKSYRLETSNNGTDWTPLKTETAGNGGTDEHTALNGAGRYLRVYGTARGTTYGYSLFEAEVYGSVDGGGTPTPTPTPTQNPTDVLITANRPATASSVEAAGFEAAKAVDGNATSRWASVEGVDPQWIQVDLGAGAKVNKVVLKWEAAYASKYKVQISPDGTAWTTLKDEIAGNGGTDEHLTPGSTGRYLRVTGTARGTAWGYSLFELEAYGTPGDGSGGPSTGTPIAKAGTLKVCGLQLCDQYGKPVQLRGMSTHGINWYKQCMTDSAFDALAKDWKADVVRISTYVDGEGSGYKYDPSLLGLAESMIQKNHDRGMYSIADWHMLEDGDPNSDLELAKKFFTSIATKHGSKGTVLYEIANEPHGVPWSTIKSYAEKIIPVIRAIDPDAVILVGTPQWSSLGVSGGGGPASIISNPVNATNIMYVFHFYATSHRDEYLAALDSTSDKLPIFVTEWGAEEYTGDGQLDFVMAEKFLTLMDQKKIGWVKWNFSDNALTGAAFKPGTCANNGPWSGSSLKPSGAWAINHVRAGAL